MVGAVWLVKLGPSSTQVRREIHDALLVSTHDSQKIFIWPVLTFGLGYTLIGAATFSLLKATGEGWTHPLTSYQHQLCDYVQCKNGYDDPPLQHWETQSIEWVKSERQLTIRTRIQPIESELFRTDSLGPIPELKLTLTDLHGQRTPYFRHSFT